MYSLLTIIANISVAVTCTDKSCDACIDIPQCIFCGNAIGLGICVSGITGCPKEYKTWRVNNGGFCPCAEYVFECDCLRRMSILRTNRHVVPHYHQDNHLTHLSVRKPGTPYKPYSRLSVFLLVSYVSSCAVWAVEIWDSFLQVIFKAFRDISRPCIHDG